MIAFFFSSKDNLARFDTCQMTPRSRLLGNVNEFSRANAPSELSRERKTRSSLLITNKDIPGKQLSS